MAEVSIKPVRLYDSDGDALDDGNGKLNVNVSGSGSANLGKAEDTAHSSGDVGVMALGVRNDTLAALGGADGDYAPLQVNATGALFVDIADGGQLDTLIDLNNTLHVLQATTNTNTGTIAGDTTEIAANFLTPGIAFSAQKGIACSAVRNDALENLYVSVGDGDWPSLQVNSIGGLYITGSEVENAAVQSQPLLMGGRYDSSARTLGDGDAGAVALNASGHILIDIIDGGQLDAVLDTIKVDTEAIETAVELLDNAISGSEMQVDVVASLPAGTNAIGIVGHDITGGADGVTTVSSAGSHVALASSTACKKVDIQAQTDNTGLIAVGFTGVDATEATGTGIILYAGDTYSLEISNLNLIYIDSTVSGEGVRYTYFT